MRHFRFVLRLPKQLRLHFLFAFHAERKSDAARQQLHKSYRFLEAYVASPALKTDASPSSPTDATLTSLPIYRILDLCTDVCDEILRRQGYPHEPPRKPAVIASGGYMPSFSRSRKRIENEKRQKLREILCLLSEQQFQRMAASVLEEVEKRVPSLAKLDAPKERRDSVMSGDSTEGLLFRHKDLEKLMGGGF